MGAILLFLAVVLVVASLPMWPYSRGWGYAPSGGLSIVVMTLILLLLMERV